MAAMLPPPGDENTLYLLDLSCWMYRFYATVQGRATHAFIEFVSKILRLQRPTYIACALDLRWPTFRHLLAPRREGSKEGYKAQRSAPDPTLLERIRWAQETLEDVHGIPLFAERGFEADDVIATLAKNARAEGMKVVIIALDKDLMQLVDEGTVLWDGKNTVVGPLDVQRKFGVRPDQLRDYLAIVGDTADNIPGVRGAGPRAAVEILQAFGDLDTALVHAELGTDPDGFFRRRPRYRELLRANPEAIRLSIKLVSLACDVPLGTSRDDLRRCA